MGVVGLGVCVALLWACREAPSAAAAGAGSPAPAPTAASSPEVYATLDGQPITSADIEAVIAQQLAEARNQQVYDVRRQAIDQIVSERLLAREAQTRGLSSEELLRTEVEAKVPGVSQEQVKAFYEANRARLQGQPLETIAPQIELYLRRQAMGERQLAFQRELREKAGVRVLLQPTRAEVPVPASAHSLGPADARVTIVEFTDYQCPFCQRAQETVEEVLRRYEGKVRLVYRDLPLEMHSRAFAASKAARCAGDQGRFWDFHRSLLASPADFSDADLQRRAGELGLKAEAFASCLASDRHDAAIREGLADASRLGVSATPTFFINGRMLSGARPFEQFREIIEEELAQGS